MPVTLCVHSIGLENETFQYHAVCIKNDKKRLPTLVLWKLLTNIFYFC